MCAGHYKQLLLAVKWNIIRIMITEVTAETKGLVIHQTAAANFVYKHIPFTSMKSLRYGRNNKTDSKSRWLSLNRTIQCAPLKLV